MWETAIIGLIILIVGFLGYAIGYVDGHTKGIREWKGPGANVHF
jgi:hypothetical protein